MAPRLHASVNCCGQEQWNFAKTGVLYYYKQPRMNKEWNSVLTDMIGSPRISMASPCLCGPKPESPDPAEPVGAMPDDSDVPISSLNKNGRAVSNRH